jgi:hypothetical protein
MMEPGASVDPRIFGQSAVMCGAWRSSARCCARAAFVDAGGSRSGIGVDSLRFFMGGGRAGTESAALRRSGLAIARHHGSLCRPESRASDLPLKGTMARS